MVAFLRHLSFSDVSDCICKAVYPFCVPKLIFVKANLHSHSNYTFVNEEDNIFRGNLSVLIEIIQWSQSIS